MSQRDTTRKQEAARLSSLLEQYYGNNSNVYPGVAAAATFSTPLGTYDSTLAAKYTNRASCPTQSSSTYDVLYTPTSGTSSTYTLSVCIESQTAAVSIH